MSIELKDWLNSINFNKENLMEDPDAKKDYPPYIINRCLSGHLDCVMFANEMNKYSSQILKSSNNTMVIVTKKHHKL